MLTGKHKRMFASAVDSNNSAIAEVSRLTEELSQEKIARMNAEAQLERARRGEDEEANHFFRFGVKPKRETVEPLASAGAGTSVAAKAGKKTK